MTSKSGNDYSRIAGSGVARDLADARMHRLAALAARALQFQDATISLVDDSGRWVLASTSVSGGRRGDLVATLDAVVGRSHRPLAVGDLSRLSGDAAFEVQGAAEGAYLGVPLINAEAALIGVLCVTDPRRQSIGAQQVGLLADFGQVASDQLAQVRAGAESVDRYDDEAIDVARAVADGEIVPWYQPIVDLSVGRIIGFEALARWNHPSGVVRLPADFVSTAERTNLILDLDLAVARGALHDLKRWQTVTPELRLSINLSGRHLDQADCVGVVRLAVENAGVSPSMVDLELTEMTRPADPTASAAMIEGLRALGFRIWYDDFGSGWSSLRDLIQIPVDGIKLDEAFAAGLGTRVADAVIRALTRASTELSLKVLVEGVETHDQALIARSLGCDYAQGFLWSRPVPAASVEQLLTVSATDWHV